MWIAFCSTLNLNQQLLGARLGGNGKFVGEVAEGGAAAFDANGIFKILHNLA